MKIILKGRPASTGMAKGKVRVIANIQDLAFFKEGEILVTKTTDPSMVLAMGKATGIITDQGGMTSHAAIVSRELGIPCVVGTENATTILKNGMEIQLNGKSGEIFLISS